MQRISNRIKNEIRVRLPIRKAKKKNEDIVIALTSFPPRYKTLFLVIRSLLHQKIRVSKIVLYLYKGEAEELPKKLLKLKKHGFEIKLVDENLGPHKKYFYALQEYSDKVVITVDDDIIYQKTLVSDLYNSYKKNSNCIIANRVHFIIKDKAQKISSYNNWKKEYTIETMPSHSLIAIGCCGVLYPPNIFPKEVFCIDAIKKYCLNADDIWLKFMELKNNIKVLYSGSKNYLPLCIRNTQGTGLFHINTECNKNDIYIKNIQNFTSINIADFLD